MIVAILQLLKFEFQKFRILEILNFHPCSCENCLEEVQGATAIPYILPPTLQDSSCVQSGMQHDSVAYSLT